MTTAAGIAATTAIAAANRGDAGKTAQPAGRAGLRWLVLAAVAVLAGCGVPGDIPMPPPGTPPADPVIIKTTSGAPATPQAAASNFTAVIRVMEPAVERECMLRRTQPINCDFQFVVDDRSGLDINAFQTLDDNGRPIIGFTLALIAAARNADELAFVVGHEASHHILNHIGQRSGAARAGAVIMSGIVAASGADLATIQAAQQMGAQVGARYYSRDWELQADYLGAILTLNAGFDPIRGAEFFARIPDPGDRILGSHPSNAQRQAQVARAVADVRAGRAR
ncbi:M48 family metallopeptidase [Paracoccus alkenifer]|uniref:Peptidase family M48 n=1 Tax=Paracoccus alkenifer TaxID=65735 RepID=A0A1H6KUU1_9RHOB|nr:M48 family metallopeptidase [Paracoccus alkenifer]SEH79484.1 Peptidase family M48 [Paracoccus alkenifer]